MTTRRWVLTTLAFALLLGTTSWATGDEHAGRDADATETWIEVYHLKEAECKSVAGAIAKIPTMFSVSPDSSTNSLIVRADRAGHEQFEQLLAKLDAPKARERSTAFIPLKFREAEGVANLIQDASTSRVRIAFDDVSRAIIVTGRPSDIAMARDIVQQTDKPHRALTLSFFFVQGTIGNGAGQGASALPLALRGVASALSNSGFMNMTLLAPMTTAVQEGSDFNASGSLDLPDGGRLMFEIEGEVHPSATPDSAEFMLGARVARVGEEDPIQVFGVETTLTATLGDYVVLAAAPAQNSENQALALIVRVD